MPALIAIVMFTALAISLALLFGYPVMLLWNWIMPDLFKLPLITFWQAVGLVVLSRLLFGSTSTTTKE